MEISLYKHSKQGRAKRKKESSYLLLYTIMLFFIGALCLYYFASRGKFWFGLLMSFLCYFALLDIYFFFKRSDEKAKKEAIARIELEEKEMYNSIDRDYQSYYKEFDKAADNRVSKYLDSNLTIEIVYLVRDEFLKTIKTSNRAPSVSEINIDLKCEVSSDRIDIGDTYYDFTIRRCSFLYDQLDQAALGKAIAIKVKEELTNYCLNHPIDTNIEISSDISYDTGYSTSVVLKYRGKNSNYQPIRQW